MTLGAVDLFKQLADNDFGFFQKITVIAELMTASPSTVSLDNTLEDALRFFQVNNFHHAPVVDPESGQVVGILSDRDVLRYRPYRLGTLTESEADGAALRTTTAQMMTRRPHSLSPADSPVDALTLMLKHRIDCVLIYDDPTDLKGIVTPRDFAKILLLFRQICRGPVGLKRMRLIDLDLDRGIPADFMFSHGAQTVRDVMTTDAVSVSEEATVETAIGLMQANTIRHLPVVNEKSHVVGIVTDRQILQRLPTPSKPRPEGTDELVFRDILFGQADLESLRERVTNIMVTQLPTPSPVARFDTVMDAFQDGASGLAVIDEHDETLCGVVTMTDLLRVCRAALMLGARS